MQFVDIHSHLVPSGDDGVTSIEAGLELLAEAADRGTSVVYATPHVWPIDGLSDAREDAVRSAHADMVSPAAELGIRLELGSEVTPAWARLAEDPMRYRLGDADAVLIDTPFRGDLELTLMLGQHVEAAGLVPILAHPERSEGVSCSPATLEDMCERGWLVQVNSSSLLGSHGSEASKLAWAWLDAGTADFVGSDGHRASRPPFLDGAYAEAHARLGASVDRLFDGSALASTSSRQPRSRAVKPGA